MSKRNYPIDAVEDLWTIFECPKCGILFFNEEKLYSHISVLHPEENSDLLMQRTFSVELIRAIPQDEKESSIGKN